MSITITEALAEIKTISKRVAKKRESIATYLVRVEAMKDPLDNDGGSVEFIKKERQAITDLENRLVQLRRDIARANAETELAIDGESRTIADWLTWRREVAPMRQSFLSVLQSGIERNRQAAAQRGVNLVSAAAAVNINDAKPQDILVNMSEADLVSEADHLQEVLGLLDGLLSLKNATTLI